MHAQHSVTGAQRGSSQSADGPHQWPHALHPAALQDMQPMPGVRIEDMGHKMG